MIVSKIDWIYQPILEAEVTVTDGFREILCFCHPCNYIIGDELNLNLQAEFVKNVFVSKSEDFLIEQQENRWSYFIRAKVIDLTNNILEVFGFKIEIEEYSLPGDTKKGDMVEFLTGRMNIY